jgi:uncharacterized protein YdeI (BOF family)
MTIDDEARIERMGNKLLTIKRRRFRFADKKDEVTINLSERQNENKNTSNNTVVKPRTLRSSVINDQPF